MTTPKIVYTVVWESSDLLCIFSTRDITKDARAAYQTTSRDRFNLYNLPNARRYAEYISTCNSIDDAVRFVAEGRLR